MELQTSFDVLSRLIDEHESHGRSVRNVEATADGADGGTLRVTMDVPALPCSASGPALEPEAAALTDEGGLQVEFSPPPVVPPELDAEAAIRTTERTASVEDGTLLVGVELVIDPAGGGGNADRAADADEIARDDGPAKRPAVAHPEPDGPEAVRDDSVPPYEDADYLRALYDSCETFSEMRDEISMDVSAETVRRYMIDADVHDPTAYETVGGEEHETETATDAGGQDAAAEAPENDDPLDRIPDEQLVADGLGLPDDVEIPDLVDAVVESTTVRGVERRLGLEQERVRGLLKQLNLLDLVLGRISDRPDREVTREEAVSRIRQCSTAASSTDGR